MRAREPDRTGTVERSGVRVSYDVYGAGEPTVLLLPAWSIVHSGLWKMQIPHLARRARVIAVDGRGNGRSDRPRAAAGYDSAEFVADALAVLDAEGVRDAVVAGVSMGAGFAVELAATAPERVAAVALIGSSIPFLHRSDRDAAVARFHERRPETTGWALFNAHAWRERYPEFVRFFFGQAFSEPHSSKPFEDCVGFAFQTDAETLIATRGGRYLAADRAGVEALLAQVRCPALVIHGGGDRISPLPVAQDVARIIGAELLVVEGGGHLSNVRSPVVVNRALDRLLDRVAPAPRATRWTRPLHRPPRVLYLSSPIGLGHARRDIAIATELRRLRPEVEVDWLAQHPLTELLSRRGERIHPASAYLAGESAHVESEAGEHDLHAFQAIRRMDEILLNNFMVFADLVRERAYDAWIGDEAWELDYYLHENPELKRAPYVWLTDFVGWLPVAGGGAAEAALTADYNAEMVAQVARLPALRDRALFVGNPEDVVPDPLGPGLPTVRAWSERNFEFVGYVTGFDPAAVADPEAVRRELGYRRGEQVCVVTVGGSGVGAHLLRRVIAAYPYARELVPRLRMVVVAGPRIDPATLPAHPGLEVRPYVDDLYRHLAVCDLAVVQGGLTTTMELTANRRPFLYVPLRNHFEQQHHVPHRLARYRAGRRLDYAETGPVALAEAIAAEIGRTVDYLPVETDGARRAAARIAELL